LGKTLQKKLIITCLLLGATSALVNIKRFETPRVGFKQALRQVFLSIDGYSFNGQIKMENNVSKFLNLDDYTYTAYKKDGIEFTLYIGYYYTADKVTVAHSPLVCFPAQGYLVEKQITKTVYVDKHKVNYTVIEAAIGTKRQLVIYWYQSYLNTAPNTFIEKFYVLYNQLVNGEGQNGLVRISIPLDNIDSNEALNAGVEFINSFYPIFIKFIDTSE